MKNVIIAGSTGMIGGLILQKCLQRIDISRITVLVRESCGFQDPKIVEVVHKDFLDFSKVEEHFKDQDVCFYCIGVYTGQVPEDEFKTITVDYTKAFFDMLRRHSSGAHVCFLSGQGADSKEKSRIMFARYKGIAENILLKLNFERTYIFRPGYIYPVAKRIEPNFSYRLMRFLYKPLIQPLFPRFATTSETLASAMLRVGLDGGSKVIYENKDIQEL